MEISLSKTEGFPVAVNIIKILREGDKKHGQVSWVLCDSVC